MERDREEQTQKQKQEQRNLVSFSSLFVPYVAYVAVNAAVQYKTVQTYRHTHTEVTSCKTSSKDGLEAN